jgi:hypothetical protein
MGCQIPRSCAVIVSHPNLNMYRPGSVTRPTCAHVILLTDNLGVAGRLERASQQSRREWLLNQRAVATVRLSMALDRFPPFQCAPSRAGGLWTFANFYLCVVDVLDRLAQVAHVEPLPAFHEVIGLGYGDAVSINSFHDRTFGFRPSSAHLRATSSTLSARQRNMAASAIEHPGSIAD